MLISDVQLYSSTYVRTSRQQQIAGHRHTKFSRSIALDIKLSTPRIAPAWRARVIHFLQILYSTVERMSHLPADLGISINLLLEAPWHLWRVPMRLHAFTELAKHKGCGVCVWYSEPLPGVL